MAEYDNDHAADTNQTMMLLNLTAMNDDEDKRIVPMKKWQLPGMQKKKEKGRHWWKDDKIGEEGGTNACFHLTAHHLHHSNLLQQNWLT